MARAQDSFDFHPPLNKNGFVASNNDSTKCTDWPATVLLIAVVHDSLFGLCSGKVLHYALQAGSYCLWRGCSRSAVGDQRSHFSCWVSPWSDRALHEFPRSFQHLTKRCRCYCHQVPALASSSMNVMCEACYMYLSITDNVVSGSKSCW